MGYPWATGDELLANDLNAAFANSAEISGPPASTAGWPFLPLSGGTVTGPTTFGDMVSMTGSYTWATGAYPGTNPAIYQSLTYTGTPSAGYAGPEGNSLPINLIHIADALNYTIAPGGVSALEIQHNSANGNGGRNALLVTHNIYGPMGATNASYCAIQAFQQFGANVTGAAAGAGNGRGDVFGISAQMIVPSGVFAHGVTGCEIDLNIQPGSSVDYLVGEQIININGVGLVANVFDCMHLLATSNPATCKRSPLGYYFGNPQAADGHGFPITATGTMIGSTTGSTGIGIDFSAVTFATAFLKSTGFTVDGSGHVAPLLANATNDAAAATAGVPIGAMYRNGNAVQVRLT